MKLLLPRPFPLGPRMKVALGGLAVLVLLVAAFDWNWLRPGLERYLSHTSGRTVRVDDLHLSLDAKGQPVVRLRGVHVQNAPWAGPQPFAVAGEARFTFSWKTLFDDVRLVTHMVLVDADIHLERQADGLRNWRLTRPNDRGPARMRVLSLEALRSRLSLVHRGVGLSLQTAATPLTTPTGPYTQRIRFSGRYHEAPFAGEALAGPVLSLQQTGDFFALRGQAQSAQTVLQLNGRMADLLKLGGLDALVQLKGPSLSQLKPFFPHQPWPASKPYSAEARLTKDNDTITARAMRASLGSSDLAGEFSYDEKDGRSAVDAKLQSARLDIADLPSAARPATAGGTAAEPGLRVLPQAVLNLKPLGGIDATLELRVKTLLALPLPTLQSVRASAALDQGLLQLSLSGAQLAGGRLNGELVLDSRPTPASVRVDLRARRLRLERLWPDMPERAHIEGPLSGQLKLNGRGGSVAAWIGSASGQLSLAMESGSLSERLDAKLGLNGGKLMRTFFTGDRSVPIRCGAIAIDFADGTGHTRQFVLDTAQMRIEGEGSLHLRDETWAVLLTPQAHKRALLALNSSVLAQGSFRGFSYELAERKRSSKAANGACAASCAAASASRCD